MTDSTECIFCGRPWGGAVTHSAQHILGDRLHRHAADLFRTVLADVPQHQSGIGSGILVTVQQSALALGVASLGSVYLSVAKGNPAHGFSFVIVGEAILFAAVGAGSWMLLGARGRERAEAASARAAVAEM